MIDRLQQMERRYEELGQLLGDEEVLSNLALLQTYAREHTELGEIVGRFRELRRLEVEIDGTGSLIEDAASEPELRDLARDEMGDLVRQRDEHLEALRDALVPAEPNDQKNAILEIRGAAGGEEANLFARELFRMYASYAEQQRWKVEILDLNETGIGGYKEVIAKIDGGGVFGKLKYESGVHRVQRIPVTESGGRIHTSTATVIVLPEAEEVDVEVRPEDLKIDVYRSQGHGGQGVNTTDSAVRITHLPTGIVVTCQNERSQLQNKASALAVLRARLYDVEQERRARQLGEQRRSQVQTGERSEKIRTYNFPQDRVTDHRINLTLHNLPSVLAGNIGGMIDELSARDRADRVDGAA